MRYSELLETPIGNIEAHGMDYEGTFPAADRKLLTNPGHIEKIRRKFERTPFLFDLYFFNRSYADRYIRHGRFTAHWLRDMERYHGITNPVSIKKLIGLDINPDANAITVIFLSNANAESTINMTPWIVAHRIAHVITTSQTVPIVFEKEIPGTHYEVIDFMTMRSARTDNMLEGEEAVEMIAQYIMQGKVTLKVPDGLSSSIGHNVAAHEAEINKGIQQALKNSVGQMFMTL